MFATFELSSEELKVKGEDSIVTIDSNIQSLSWMSKSGYVEQSANIHQHQNAGSGSTHSSSSTSAAAAAASSSAAATGASTGKAAAKKATDRSQDYQEGWLATGTDEGIIGCTFTTCLTPEQYEFLKQRDKKLKEGGAAGTSQPHQPLTIQQIVSEQLQHQQALSSSSSSSSAPQADTPAPTNSNSTTTTNTLNVPTSLPNESANTITTTTTTTSASSQSTTPSNADATAPSTSSPSAAKDKDAPSGFIGHNLTRTNFNLRGHKSEIKFVRWNEPYQKLATCDSKGVIYVWVKYDGRWSIELINDRNNAVSDFSWSHDGRMAVICYQDGYVLVGSVNGNRYWAHLFDLQNASITSTTWTPNDALVLLGLSTGGVLVVDEHGTIVSRHELKTDSILHMAYNCPKFIIDEDHVANPAQTTRFRFNELLNSLSMNGMGANNANGNANGNHAGAGANIHPFKRNNKIDNNKYLLACSFKSNGVIHLLKGYDDLDPVVIDTQLEGVKFEWSNCGKILAVGGYKTTYTCDGSGVGNNKAEPSQPAASTTSGGASSGATASTSAMKESTFSRINNNLKSFSVGQFSYKKLSSEQQQKLAQQKACKKQTTNYVHFYNQQGSLIYRLVVPSSTKSSESQNPGRKEHSKQQKTPEHEQLFSALTWGHNDQRLFVACSSSLHVARVFKGIPSFCQLAQISIKKNMKDAAEVDALCLPNRLKQQLKSNFSSTIKAFYPKESQLREFVTKCSTSNERFYCTMKRKNTENNEDSYVLYLEYLGGLIALLTASKSSKLKPDFVIYDPYVETKETKSLINTDYYTYESCRAASAAAKKAEKPESETSDSINFSKQASSGYHSSASTSSHNSSQCKEPAFTHIYDEIKAIDQIEPVASASSSPDAAAADLDDIKPIGANENELDESLLSYDDDDDSWSSRSSLETQAVTSKKRRGVVTKRDGPASGRETTRLSSALKRMIGSSRHSGKQQQHKRQKATTTSAKKSDIRKNLKSLRRSFRASKTNLRRFFSQDLNRKVFPDDEEFDPPAEAGKRDAAGDKNSLVEVYSNIWGTKFRFVGKSYLPSALGQIVYKTSLFHLQPRQMTITLDDLSNFDYKASENKMKVPSTVEVAKSESKSSSKPGVANKARVEAAACKSSSKQTEATVELTKPAKEIKTAVSAVPAETKRFARADAAGAAKPGIYNTLPVRLKTNFLSSTPKLNSSLPTSSESDVSVTDSVSPLISAANPTRHELLKKSASLLLNYKSSAAAVVTDSLKVEKSLSEFSKSYYNIHQSTGEIEQEELQIREYKEEPTRLDAKETMTTTTTEPSKDGGHYLLNEQTSCSQRISTAQQLVENKLVKNFQVENEYDYINEQTNDEDGDMKEKADFFELPVLFLANNLATVDDFADNDYYDIESGNMCYLIKSNTFDGDLESSVANVGINLVSVNDDSIISESGVGVSLGATNSLLQSKQAVFKSSRFYRKFLNTFSAKSLRLRFRNSKTTIGKNHTSTSSLNAKENTRTSSTTNEPRNGKEDETDLNNNAGGANGENSSTEPVSAQQQQQHQQQQPRSSNDEVVEASVEEQNVQKENEKNLAKNSIDESAKEETIQKAAAESDKKEVDEESAKQAAESKQTKRRKNSQKTTTKKATSKIGQAEKTNQFVLHNKPPIWNEMSQVYQLDFGGRVTQESAKNFQIEYATKQVMQFGRIEANAYTLDFEWPFTTVQAFSIALANITQRLK